MPRVPVQLATDVKPLLDRAVETGTAFGDSSALLAEIFEQVVTVELSPQYAASARERFAGNSRVTVLEGDSGELLRRIAAPEVATLYFLDSHWTGGPSPAGRDASCPVVKELEALAERGCQQDVVIVDDVRLFVQAPPGHGRWPTLEELYELVSRAYPRHRLLVADDQLIALSPRARFRVGRRAAVRRVSRVFGK